MERLMRFGKCWLPVVVAYGLSMSAAFAADCNPECDRGIPTFAEELDERDFEAVTEYVNSKRTIEIEEKACNLAISGDVRFEWSYITEKVNGIVFRDGRSPILEFI